MDTLSLTRVCASGVQRPLTAPFGMARPEAMITQSSRALLLADHAEGSCHRHAPTRRQTQSKGAGLHNCRLSPRPAWGCILEQAPERGRCARHYVVWFAPASGTFVYLDRAGGLCWSAWQRHACPLRRAAFAALVWADSSRTMPLHYVKQKETCVDDTWGLGCRRLYQRGGRVDVKGLLQYAD